MHSKLKIHLAEVQPCLATTSSLYFLFRSYVAMALHTLYFRLVIYKLNVLYSATRGSDHDLRPLCKFRSEVNVDLPPCTSNLYFWADNAYPPLPLVQIHVKSANIGLIPTEQSILFMYPLDTHLQLTFLCELRESSFALLMVCPVQVQYSRGITAKGWELRVLLFPV